MSVLVLLLLSSISATFLPKIQVIPPTSNERYDYIETSTAVNTGTNARTRMRRFGQTENNMRTLNPDQIKDVKAALRDILGIDKSGFSTTSEKSFYTDAYELEENVSPLRGRNWWVLGRQGNDTTETTVQEYKENVSETRICYTFPKTYTTTTVVTTEKIININIKYILELVKNLTEQEYYGSDITIHESLVKHFNELGVKTCGLPTTTTVTTTEPIYDFLNTSIAAKCYVCGMEAEGIPRDAECADAFAGDFIPLIPVDPRAKGRISAFRKYCRVLDVQGTLMNPLEPRAIYGRWTGGCGVRWTDITGVYTQRSCRNRHRPMMGKHLASKRMAKLELALTNVDNGCIISPMATLLPLSRGVSLFARFHACVCTGSWCNNSFITQPSTWLTVLNLLKIMAVNLILRQFSLNII